LEDLDVNPQFWADKRVFLTGHTGFKGSWLSLALQDMGATVRGYARPPPTNPSLFELAQVATGMGSIEGDVRTFESLQAAVSGFKPDIVFHLAAQALVRPSYDDPVYTYATNVMGTVNMLEAVRRCEGVRAVVIVTSDKCYQNNEWIWGYRENEPMGGYDPYSSSKGCAELVTSAMRSSYFNPRDYALHRTGLASVRAGNVVGGGDWAMDRLIPDMVVAFSQGRKAVIRNPEGIRPWQHVLDSLSGYLSLAEELWRNGAECSEAWNFGADDEQSRTVAWIADRVVQIWGGKSGWESAAIPNTRHEAHHLKLDCSKAKARLDWRPRLDLNQALEWTIAWYLAHSKGGDMRSETLRQIRRYREYATT